MWRWRGSSCVGAVACLFRGRLAATPTHQILNSYENGGPRTVRLNRTGKEPESGAAHSKRAPPVIQMKNKTPLKNPLRQVSAAEKAAVFYRNRKNTCRLAARPAPEGQDEHPHSGQHAGGGFRNNRYGVRDSDRSDVAAEGGGFAVKADHQLIKGVVSAAGISD